MQGKTAFREQGFQRFRTLAELLQMLGPVDLDTAFHHRRAKNKRSVDKVMQASGNQNALKENIDPDP